MMTKEEIQRENERLRKDYEEQLEALKIKLGMDDTWDESDVNWIEKCFSQTWEPKYVNPEFEELVRKRNEPSLRILREKIERAKAKDKAKQLNK